MEKLFNTDEISAIIEHVKEQLSLPINNAGVNPIAHHPDFIRFLLSEIDSTSDQGKKISGELKYLYNYGLQHGGVDNYVNFNPVKDNDDFDCRLFTFLPHFLLDGIRQFEKACYFEILTDESKYLKKDKDGYVTLWNSWYKRQVIKGVDYSNDVRIITNDKKGLVLSGNETNYQIENFRISIPGAVLICITYVIDVGTEQFLFSDDNGNQNSMRGITCSENAIKIFGVNNLDNFSSVIYQHRLRIPYTILIQYFGFIDKPGEIQVYLPDFSKICFSAKQLPKNCGENLLIGASFNDDLNLQGCIVNFEVYKSDVCLPFQIISEIFKNQNI